MTTTGDRHTVHAEDAWDDRLAAFVERSAEREELDATAAHLSDCPICQRRAAVLEGIDRGLRASIVDGSPGSAFDHAVLTRIAEIECLDDVRAARERIVTMASNDRAVLAKLWRRTRADVVLNAAGGAAIAIITALLCLHSPGAIDAVLSTVRVSTGTTSPVFVAAGTAVAALLARAVHIVGRNRGLI